MNTVPLPAACSQPKLQRSIALIASSYRSFLGRPLAQCQDGTVGCLWSADDAIVAHGTQADPVFFFGNAAALRLFETDWEGFTTMPSRLSAEVPERAERQRLLDRVTANGFVDDYSGVRISALGRRFFIPRATVWNVVDERGALHGQAATFPAQVETVPPK